MTRLLTLPEVAEALGLSHPYVWRLAVNGRLDTVVIGRVRGVTPAELERFRQLPRRPHGPRPSSPRRTAQPSS